MPQWVLAPAPSLKDLSVANVRCRGSRAGASSITRSEASNTDDSLCRPTLGHPLTHVRGVRHEDGVVDLVAVVVGEVTALQSRRAIRG